MVLGNPISYIIGIKLGVLGSERFVEIIPFSSCMPDSNDYVSWAGDAKSNPFIAGVRVSYSMSQHERYIEEKTSNPNVRFWGICIKSSQLIGAIKLEPVDFAEKTAWLGMLIGAPEFRARGYGGEAINQVLTYARDVLFLKKILLGVGRRNIAAYSLYKKLNFAEVKSEGFLYI